jgi:ribonuclease Z
MKDREFTTIHTERFTIEGRSRAGNETWFRIPDFGVAFDVGRGPEAVVRVPHVFVSHAHLDHSLGIPYYAGQRRLQRLPPGSVYIPYETLDDFRELMAIHERLEDVAYDMNLVGMKSGDVVRIRRDAEVRAHRATHRVPANAYELVEIKHRLRPELAGMDGEQLARLHLQGEEVNEEVRSPLLFYTGDTDRRILEKSDAENDGAMFKAYVLMIECSFVIDGHQDRAEKYRHIHFDDLADFAERFENHYIVLTHFSLRYSPAQIQETLRRRCPAILRDRIRLALPEPWQRISG